MSQILKRTIEFYWNSTEWLANRMLFLSGPRQVGKTTLVKDKLLLSSPDAYYNWDTPKVRRAYQQDPEFFAHHPKGTWICFDEIHKRPKWKNILKGVYDEYRDQYKIAVTGSAKLETFRRSGDSLFGRYFSAHLFPLAVSDFTQRDFLFYPDANDLIDRALDEPDHPVQDDLLKLGGFPEPFFSSREQFWKRWSIGHRDLIIREDLRDLSRLTHLDQVETLYEILKTNIGQNVVLRDLGNDLETDHHSIKRWLGALEQVHLLFQVTPYSKNIRRSFRAEKRWYYTDWRDAGELCFENYVASTLLRACTLWRDRFGEAFDLHYIRTHDKQEVDFLITHDKKPWLLIEAKEGKPDLTSAVYRFNTELGVPALVVTRKTGVAHLKKETRIAQISFSKLAALLP